MRFWDKMELVFILKLIKKRINSQRTKIMTKGEEDQTQQSDKMVKQWMKLAY